MAVHPLSAAKRVCELKDWTATNLAVNKILYLANMLYLGRNGGRDALVNQSFEAWDYGPVIPAVYHRAKAFGSDPVQNVFVHIPDITAGSPEGAIIAETVAGVSDKTPGQLVAMTHWERGAWAKCYRPGVHGLLIPNEEILAEYARRVG